MFDWKSINFTIGLFAIDWFPFFVTATALFSFFTSLNSKKFYIPKWKSHLHPRGKKTFTSPPKKTFTSPMQKRCLHTRSKKDVYIPEAKKMFTSPKQKRRLHPRKKRLLHSWKEKTFTSLKKKMFTSLKLIEIFIPETFTSQKSKQPIDKNPLHDFGFTFIFQLMNLFLRWVVLR